MSNKQEQIKVMADVLGHYDDISESIDSLAELRNKITGGEEKSSGQNHLIILASIIAQSVSKDDYKDTMEYITGIVGNILIAVEEDGKS